MTDGAYNWPRGFMCRSFADSPKVSIHQGDGCQNEALLRGSRSTGSWGEPNKSRCLVLDFLHSVHGTYAAKKRVEQVPGGEILQMMSRERRVKKVGSVDTCQRLWGGGKPFPEFRNRFRIGAQYVASHPVSVDMLQCAPLHYVAATLPMSSGQAFDGQDMHSLMCNICAQTNLQFLFHMSSNSL